MPRKPSIDEATGQRLIDAYQRLGSKQAAAREIGVSADAAQRFLQALPAAAAPALASQRSAVEASGASLWDTRAALEANYGRCLELLASAQALDLSEPRAVVANAAVLKEIRAHVEGSMELAKLLIDIDEVRAFQRTVVEVFHECDPAAGTRLADRLRERRALGFLAGGPGARAG